MATFVILFAVAGFSLLNYELAYGWPWRPRRFYLKPETPRDRLERWMALAVTTLLIVATALVLLAVKVAR